MEVEDLKQAHAAVYSLLLHVVGEDPEREGLRGTPDRVVRMYQELTQGYRQDPKHILGAVFSEGHDEMVIVKDIPFYSLCEHHLVPFFGVAHVGYIPRGGKVVGISKIARLVECFARRLQIQERLTTQVADSIDEHLMPLGVGVVVEAEHLCMSMRGIQKPGTKTVTSVMRGLLMHGGMAREEFLRLVKGGS